MAKKILTVEDLLAFCEQNKLYSFDSHKDGYEFVVNIPATFDVKEEETEQHLEGLIPFESKAFHDHVNLNGSNIEEDTFENELPSAHLRPILAHIVETDNGEKDFGAHDFHKEKRNGETVIIYDEQPIGVIDGSQNEIQFDEEAGVNRAILKGYLWDYCTDALEILDRRGNVACSVELSVRQLGYDADKKVITLISYYVSGLTLLGADKQPGMAGSEFGIVEYSKKEFTYDEKLIEVLEKLNNTLSTFKQLEKGGTTVTKFEELLQKYNKTVEDITFEYEGLTDEELEAKFAEAFEEHEPESEPEQTTVEYSITMGDINRTFSLSLTDKRRAAYRLISNTYDDDWYDVEMYDDDNYLEMYGWFTGKNYRQKFTRENDTFALEGERVEVFAKYLTQEQLDQVTIKNTEFEALKAENEELKKYKSDKEFEIAHNERMAVIADYSSIAETEEYKSLLNDIDKYSVEEITEKADAIVGKYARQGKQFSFEKKETPAHQPKVFIKTNENTNNNTPAYGGIFD